MKLGIIVALVSITGLTTFNLWKGFVNPEVQMESIPAGGLYTVARGTLKVTITENGTLVAKESQQIVSQHRGGGEITFLVDEGSHVEEGEVLCRLDSTDEEERVEQLDMEIVRAVADLDTARTEQDIQVIESAAAHEKALAALDRARQELQRYVEGDVPNERRKLGVAIDEAETRYARAKKKAADSQMLFDQDFISEVQRDEDQIAAKTAKVQLKTATEELNLFEKYTFPMTVAQREEAVRDAERQLDTGAQRAATTKRQKEVAVEQAQKHSEKLSRQLTETKEQIEKMVLKAPAPGIVLYGDPRRWWSRRDIKVGGRVWSGSTVFTIPDLRVMQVKLWIHEADINKIEEGQSARVTMDTYPGLLVNGTVAKIASIADNEDEEVKRFSVEITLEATEDLELRPGISAKAEIAIDRLEDVVHVPLQCVFSEDGTYYCYAMGEDGTPKRVTVKPGQSNDHYLAILEGLEEGTRVLLYNPNLPGGPFETEPLEKGETGEKGEQGAPPAGAANPAAS